MENPEATRGGGWLRPSEAAELFGVHRVTLARWAKAGKLGVQPTAGGHRRYREDDARALLAELKAVA